MSEEKSLTLGCNNDQTLVQTEPTAFKGNGNPTGGKTCTITGDHADRVTDFTPLVVGAFIGGSGSKARSIGYVDGASPTLKAMPSGGNTVLEVVCYNPHDAQSARIYGEDGAFHSLNANEGGGMARDGVFCVHGSQDPISNTEHANAINRNNGLENIVCYPINEQCISHGANADLRQGDGIGKCNDGAFTTIATTHNDCHAIAIAENTIGRQPQNGGNGQGFKEDVAYTQETVAPQGVAFRGSVRRLLPVETELLMGFPRNWTRIPWRGKPAEECPDAPRYKACGNSMGVNCMRWIGLGIEAVERKINEQTK